MLPAAPVLPLVPRNCGKDGLREHVKRIANKPMDECRAALKELADNDQVRAVLVRGEGRPSGRGST